MPQRIFIRDMPPNQFLDGVFAIQNCQLGVTKGGKPFIKCLLADRTGRAPGRMWNASEELFSILPTDGFVWIQGQSQPYQGEMQIIIQQIRAHKPSGDDLLDLLPCSQFDAEEMFTQLKAILATIKNPSLRALADIYLDDEELMTKFKRAPAAMTLHHAFISGLLEHTLALLRLAQVFCPLYPQLNAEIVLMGLFLHDLGKCVELTWETGFGYSEDGQLVGHIARGVIWLQRKAEDSAALGHKIPEPVLRVLHHIILSHHGQPEFGALKLPATPEAIAVSLLDNVDAKLHMAIAATRSGAGNKAEAVGGNFTEKIWALDTRLYRPDPTTVKEQALPLHDLARAIGVRTGMLPPVKARQAQATRIQCMEVWGGNSAVTTAVEVAGLDTWVLSLPFEGDREGGDVHYISTCGSGRVSRFVVADVSGHGANVGELAQRLRLMMRKHVNVLNMARFARELNREFGQLAHAGKFATALLMTYFATTDHLVVCNAGHPRPLWYRAAQKRWEFLHKDLPDTAASLEQVSNLPLGVIEPTQYVQFAVKLEPGDVIVAYTDSMIEASAPGTGDQLGEEGFMALAQGLTPSTTKALADQFLAAVAAHRGGAPSDDDQTLMVLAHNGANPPPMTRAWAAITEMARVVGIIDY